MYLYIHMCMCMYVYMHMYLYLCLYLHLYLCLCLFFVFVYAASTAPVRKPESTSNNPTAPEKPGNQPYPNQLCCVHFWGTFRVRDTKNLNAQTTRKLQPKFAHPTFIFRNVANQNSFSHSLFCSSSSISSRISCELALSHLSCDAQHQMEIIAHPECPSYLLGAVVAHDECGRAICSTSSRNVIMKCARPFSSRHHPRRRHHPG